MKLIKLVSMEQQIKIAWIKRTEGNGKKGAYVKYDLRDNSNPAKFYTAFVSKAITETQLQSLRKNMSIKVELPDTPVQSGFNPQIQKILEVYNTTPAQASPAQSPPSGELGTGRLRSDEPDKVVPETSSKEVSSRMPEPLTDKQIEQILNEVDVWGSKQNLSIPAREELFKAKLQSQHQQFEVQMAKHKESVWNKR